MGNLLTIGEFSRATRLSVKALRFYDEKGILRPVWVDEATGYRHYSAGQFVEALRIRRLRELDVPLEEIRAFLGARDPDAIAAFLDRHRQVLQEREPHPGHGPAEGPYGAGRIDGLHPA